jgi:hypothetical protein
VKQSNDSEQCITSAASVCACVSIQMRVYTCECVSDSIGDFADGETDSLGEMRQSPYKKNGKIHRIRYGQMNRIGYGQMDRCLKGKQSECRGWGV